MAQRMDTRNSMNVEIWIRTGFIGFHQWLEAPEEVAYLRNLHRHVFGVKVTAKVTHRDRDIEFHILKKATDAVLVDLKAMLEKDGYTSLSCEEMAVFIHEGLKHKGFDSVSVVEVDEDRECGARVRF